MTVANWITLFRVLLIPVFVAFAIYYGESVQAGAPVEWFRWAAIATFVLASLSDAFDGWVARRFNQRSRLGVLLDPLADKALVLTAIVTLAVTGWPEPLPIWFAVLVIGRDAVIMLGCVVLKHFDSNVEVRPSWTGKTATALLMISLTWVMLQLPGMEYPVWTAALFIAVSGLEYIGRGVRQLRSHGTPEAGR